MLHIRHFLMYCTQDSFLMFKTNLDFIRRVFLWGKSTINQIFGWRQILEKFKEFGISIHLHFIHFKSAYDGTDREQIYVAMNELNIPQKLIRLVKMIMQSQIKIQSKHSSTFILQKGVRHSLACLLFNITLKYAI